MIEKYDPDAHALRETMQRNLTEEQQRRIDQFEEEKAKYEEKLDKYYHRQIEVIERHQALDDRYFKILSEATNSCLNTRFLDNRQKHAYDILTTPIEDLSYEEDRVNKLEESARLVEEKLGFCDNDEIEKQLEQEEKECQELIFLNAQRNNDIALRRQRVSQELLLKPTENPVFEKDTGMFNPALPQQNEISDTSKPIELYRRTAERLIQIDEEMKRIDQEEARNRELQKESIESYRVKIDRFIQLMAEADEVMKFESFVNEFVFANGKLFADLNDEKLKTKEIHDELKQRGIEVEELRKFKNPNHIAEREEQIAKRRAQLEYQARVLEEKKAAYEQHLQEMIEYSKKEKEHLKAVDALMAQLNNIAAKTQSADEMAQKLVDQIHGVKDVPTTSESSISKIEELQRNLAMLKIDVSDEESED